MRIGLSWLTPIDWISPMRFCLSWLKTFDLSSQILIGLRSLKRIRLNLLRQID